MFCFKFCYGFIFFLEGEYFGFLYSNRSWIMSIGIDFKGEWNMI